MRCQKCGYEVLDDSIKYCPKCGNKLSNPTLEETIPLHDISSIWPEWKIEKQLGKGSYGTVYQAIRKTNNLESHAAIKIISIPSNSSEVDSLRSDGLDDNGIKTYFSGVVDDFVNEIQLMETLKGIQNIVSVEDYKVIEKSNQFGWDIYIRMELLTDFNTYISKHSLSEQDVIKLGIDICTALEVCGQRNIIHRDIKPENIFINDFGFYKLGDFGIARKLENLTGGLSQKGTLFYMAPEVATTNQYDSRVDTYSLGLVLYRLLNNNRLPFIETEQQLLSPNGRKEAVERRIRGDRLPPPRMASPTLANVILRACAYNPDARFANPTQMKRALATILNNGAFVATSGGDTISIASQHPLQKTVITSVEPNETTVLSQQSGYSNSSSNVSGALSQNVSSQTINPVVSPQNQVLALETQKTKKKKTLPLIIIAIVAVLGIIGLISLFSSGGDDEFYPPDVENTLNETTDEIQNSEQVSEEDSTDTEVESESNDCSSDISLEDAVKLMNRATLKASRQTYRWTKYSHYTTEPSYDDRVEEINYILDVADYGYTFDVAIAKMLDVTTVLPDDNWSCIVKNGVAAENNENFKDEYFLQPFSLTPDDIESFYPDENSITFYLFGSGNPSKEMPSTITKITNDYIDYWDAYDITKQYLPMYTFKSLDIVYTDIVTTATFDEGEMTSLMISYNLTVNEYIIENETYNHSFYYETYVETTYSFR